MENKESEQPKVARRYTRRSVMLIISGGAIILCLILLIFYLFNPNMILGAPAIIVGFAGGMVFYYYWTKEADVAVEHVGKVPQTQVNCLNIYPDRIVFEDWQGEEEPDWPQWVCLNDQKRYWVNIQNKNTKELEALALPDQQYYDPEVFAQRVLELPAHRRIFRRREKPGQYLKTLVLVGVIAVIWIMIITTT